MRSKESFFEHNKVCQIYYKTLRASLQLSSPTAFDYPIINKNDSLFV